jgi:thiol:disulfide interchange protein DsbC
MLKTDVTDIRKAPVGGLWEVEGLQNGRKFVVYIDYGKKFVVLVKDFISVEEVGKPPQLKKLDVSKITTEDAIIMGNPNAKYKFIVFDDVECPYCKKLHQEIKKVIKERKDIAFLIKLFPLDIHPTAYEKSRSVYCNNKSEKLLDDAFEGKTLPKANCEAKVIDENIKLAKRLGINGTPAIIFPDGRLLPGYVEAPTLIKMLESPEQ